MKVTQGVDFDLMIGEWRGKYTQSKGRQITCLGGILRYHKEDFFLSPSHNDAPWKNQKISLF